MRYIFGGGYEDSLGGVSISWRGENGGVGDLVLGRAVDGLAVVLVDVEGAGEEAFGCGYDVEGVSGDV